MNTNKLIGRSIQVGLGIFFSGWFIYEHGLLRMLIACAITAAFAALLWVSFNLTHR